MRLLRDFRTAPRRGRRRPPAPTGVTHDFSSTGWGHNLTITAILEQGVRLRVACWVGRRPQGGDRVILRGGDGETTRYRVLDAEPGPFVGDMYYLNLLFDPRTAAKSDGGTDDD